jgi:cytosine/adenosine deaminase-related metal-dependent hydrolase
MPGLICAHTHFYGAFSRGMAVPGKPSRNFQEILANLWWKLDKGLDEEGVKYSALALLADATRYGCTTLFDHHASPNCIDGSLDIEADAVTESGLRASLCYELLIAMVKKKPWLGYGRTGRFIIVGWSRELQPNAESPFWFTRQPDCQR